MGIIHQIRFHRAILSLVLLIWTGTSFSKEESTDAKAAIIAANDGYVQAIIAGDLDTLMTFYTQDAVLLPPLSPPVIGRNAVRANWAEAFEQFIFVEAVSVFDEIVVLGNWAYGRGRYEGRNTLLNGSGEFEENLNFSGLWHRDAEGSWKIARDMWNDSVTQ